MRTARVSTHVRTAVTPPADGHRPALRVALGLAVPGLGLLGAGHPALIVYAVFGAITGMYGRDKSAGRRAVQQSQAAVMLVTGVGIGAVLSQARAAPVVLVSVAVAFAMLWSVLADLLDLTPQGPFYGIFALGAVATVPPSCASPTQAVVICAATSLLGIALGAIDAPRGGAAIGRRAPLSLSKNVGTHAARYGLAVALAGTIGLLLGVDHANWAMAAAAGPLAAADTRARVGRGLHRVIGTAIGLVVAAILLMPQPGEYVLAIAVMVLLFPTELFMSHNHAVALGFFTPLIMVMAALSVPTEPRDLLIARGIDTVIGVAAALAIVVLVRGAPPKGEPAGPNGE